MKLEYPNLELLDFKAKLALKEYGKQHDKVYDHIDFEADVFPQLWSSTALGFGGVGGQAMTTAYTTVFHDVWNDVYVICFDRSVAYMVEEANEKFMSDLRDRCVASIKDALRLY